MSVFTAVRMCTGRLFHAFGAATFLPPHQRTKTYQLNSKMLTKRHLVEQTLQTVEINSLSIYLSIHTFRYLCNHLNMLCNTHQDCISSTISISNLYNDRLPVSTDQNANKEIIKFSDFLCVLSSFWEHEIQSLCVRLQCFVIIASATGVGTPEIFYIHL